MYSLEWIVSKDASLTCANSFKIYCNKKLAVCDAFLAFSTNYQGLKSSWCLNLRRLTVPGICMQSQDRKAENPAETWLDDFGNKWLPWQLSVPTYKGEARSTCTPSCWVFAWWLISAYDNLRQVTLSYFGFSWQQQNIELLEYFFCTPTQKICIPNIFYSLTALI